MTLTVTAAAGSTITGMAPRAGLDGPSRTIIVEPAEQPAIAPAREEPAPEREPAPREPEREPEKVPA